MSFSSAVFLWFFLGVFLIRWGTDFLFPKLRLIIIIELLIFSFIFYSFFSPLFLFLFLWLGFFDFSASLALERANREWHRKTILVLSLSHSLGLLFFFKYSSYLLSWFGQVWEIPLPLGISFFVFQSISYVVAVFRKEKEAETNPLRFLLFLSFFPQMVAGPIVSAKDFLPQLSRPLGFLEIPWAFSIFLLLLGFFKKTILADSLVPLVDQAFGNPSEGHPSLLWMGLFAYALQIYCDFSGYTDIAQGSALMLGFVLPENFRMPYLAASFSEFWTRWHISLSQWLRHHLYIPLGGNRGSLLETYRNLVLVMVLGGIWHGANLTFLVWGLGHGLFLVCERFLGLKEQRKFSGWFVTQAVVLFLWIFFRSPDFTSALWYAQGLFLKNGDFLASYSLQMTFLKVLLIVGIGHVLGFQIFSSNEAMKQWFAEREEKPGFYWIFVGLSILVLFLIVFLGAETQSFLYFVF